MQKLLMHKLHETQDVILLYSSVTTTELKPPVSDPGSVMNLCCTSQIVSLTLLFLKDLSSEKIRGV